MKDYELSGIGYNSEEEAWREIQGIRKDFTPEVFGGIRANSREDTVRKAAGIVQRVIKEAGNSYGFSRMEPGHGRGHLLRDYMNSLVLFSNLDTDPRYILPGFIGGSLHDLGCALIPRYEESTRAVRHAEVGALLVRHMLGEFSDLNEAEKLAATYAIAAHTNYTRESVVECSDGEKRTIKPYEELDTNGEPLWPVWFTRWVDRLDINGPTFVGRHYLTLGEEHEDYAEGQHYSIKFHDHMRPLLRKPEEQTDTQGNKSKTMVEHLQMFSNSQTNNSPFGKYDHGFMVELRDMQKSRLDRIIKETQKRDPNFDSENTVRDNWITFLSRSIEPSQQGRQTAEKLDESFGSLESSIRHPWCNAFLETMREYNRYATGRLALLELIDPELYALEPITRDITHAISPKIYV